MDKATLAVSAIVESKDVESGVVQGNQRINRIAEVAVGRREDRLPCSGFESRPVSTSLEVAQLRLRRLRSRSSQRPIPRWLECARWRKLDGREAASCLARRECKEWPRRRRWRQEWLCQPSQPASETKWWIAERRIRAVGCVIGCAARLRSAGVSICLFGLAWACSIALGFNMSAHYYANCTVSRIRAIRLPG